MRRRMQHLTHKKLMVAHAVIGDFFAHEVRQGTAYQWRFARLLRALDSSKSIWRAAGELTSNVRLMRCEHADAEMGCVNKSAVQPRIDAQAPLHQRWIKRYRAERISRHTHGCTVLVEGRDDGDTGGEARERVA